MDDILKYGRQKTIVVTGADRGLGFELVRQYLERGDRVFAGKYRNNWHLLEGLKETWPETLQIVPLDVRSQESVRHAADLILEKTDAVDILINNAGVWLDHDTGTILDDRIDYDAILEQIQVNALGALRVTQALIGAVLNSFDQLVVNVSSEAASMTECSKDSQFGYCMSKAALNMATKLLDNYLADRSIRLLAVQPGWMRTDMGGQNADLDPYDAAAQLVRLFGEMDRTDREPLFVGNDGTQIPW